MTIAELLELIVNMPTRELGRPVLALVQGDDQPHREVTVEIDCDGDLVVTVLSW